MELSKNGVLYLWSMNAEIVEKQLHEYTVELKYLELLDSKQITDNFIIVEKNIPLFWLSHNRKADLIYNKIRELRNAIFYLEDYKKRLEHSINEKSKTIDDVKEYTYQEMKELLLFPINVRS